ITLVDTIHAQQQLDQFAIAQSQIGYADRILLTKTDIQPASQQLLARLRRINARAPTYTVINGQIDLALLFNVKGFMLNDTLEVKQPLFRFQPEKQDDIQSIVLNFDYPVELQAVSDVMESLLLSFADNLLRYKGILN
ncbi:GTP-binding protein, partial [Escherichia coli]